MIQQTLSLITGNLNTYLKQSLNLIEDVVVLSAIVNADGSSVPAAANKIVLSLVHVSTDQTFRNAPTIGFSTQTPYEHPLHLKLQLLCAANFQDYAEGLNLLSLTMKYFQATPVVTATNTPGAQATPVKIQTANFSATEIQQLWLALGAKYLPSVVYEVSLAEI